MESKLSLSRWTALFWIFPVLFLIDDVLGLNGYQFTVHGIGIRILLFCLSAASLGLYCVWAIVRSRMTIFRRKTCFFFWDYWRTLDWFVLGFLVLNAVHATVIPVLVRGKYDLRRQGFYNAAGAGALFPVCVSDPPGPAAGEKAHALALPAAGAAGRVAQCDALSARRSRRAFMPSIMT